MKKHIYLFIFCCLIALSCKEKQPEKLHIAVAANMQFAMKDLTKKFTEQSGIECETVISSSGKLTAQIKQNAPYDVFVAADMKYPTELFNAGFTTAKPKVYAHGKLVLWTMNNGVQPSVEVLKTEQIKHISIANPKLAPYGKATVEVLEHFGMYEDVKDKLVYGESISQANQFIISNAAQIGFTAKSVVLSPELKGKGKWIDLDENLYSPIAQGMVILKRDGAENKNAQQFYDFLFSVDAKKILQQYGYQ
ncbi:molybdate ABC transporter substrate-binding protein [Chryseobacterium sp.]|uniref:molybdate ABC transporter substrate-binding protein n=1 Tax=Chryseobacterium sp. TaxID=1871047 RepID=UPI0028967645|nr:molybdate ABC transporter substrate-binding protein [Chryseobacterium sp.]